MMDSGSGQTMDTVFAGAIEIEYKLAEIYGQFSRLFSHVQGLSAFWQGLSNDEVRHATSLRAARESLAPNHLLMPCDKGVWDNVMRIQRILNKDLVGAINTVDDAYELAHDMEFSEVNVIFKFLTAEFVPSDERKQFVHSEIAQHQRKLLDFSLKFGDKAWRKGIGVRRISGGQIAREREV